MPVFGRMQRSCPQDGGGVQVGFPYLWLCVPASADSCGLLKRRNSRARVKLDLNVPQAQPLTVARSQLKDCVLYSAQCAIAGQPRTGLPPAQVAIMPGARPHHVREVLQTERRLVELQPVLPIQHGQQELRAASALVGLGACSFQMLHQKAGHLSCRSSTCLITWLLLCLLHRLRLGKGSDHGALGQLHTHMHVAAKGLACLNHAFELAQLASGLMLMQGWYGSCRA